MHLYSIILSAIATFSSLIENELFPACFSSINKFNLSQTSLGSDDKYIAFETPEAETIILGELSNFISVQSQVDLLPRTVLSIFISLAKPYNNFFIHYTSKINIIVFMSYHFQKISFQIK